MGAIEVVDEIQERGYAVLRHRLRKQGNILSSVGVGGRREAVGDGSELETREALDGIGATGLEQAVVVELSVDEGDEEAPVVEEFSELENRGNMALCRIWDDTCSLLLKIPLTAKKRA